MNYAYTVTAHLVDLSLNLNEYLVGNWQAILCNAEVCGTASGDVCCYFYLLKFLKCGGLEEYLYSRCDRDGEMVSHK